MEPSPEVGPLTTLSNSSRVSVFRRACSQWQRCSLNSKVHASPSRKGPTESDKHRKATNSKLPRTENAIMLSQC